MAERYAHADRILYGTIDGTIRNTVMLPHWIGKTDTFWCERWRGGVREFVVVNPAKGTVRPAFEASNVSAAIAKAARRKVADVEVQALRHGKRGQMQIRALGAWWAKNSEGGFGKVDEGSVESTADPSQIANRQGTLAAFVRQHNIWVRDLISGEERALTNDGERDLAYGVDSQTSGTRMSMERLGIPLQVRGAWSPDGQTFFTHRVDERSVARLAVSHLEGSGGTLPTMQAYRYAIPGSAEVPHFQPLFLDALTGQRVTVRVPGMPATRMAFSPFVCACAWWSQDGRTAYLVDIERGERRVTVYSVDVATGDARIAFQETSETCLDLGWDVYGPIGAHYLAATDQLLWMSERTGWMQLYRYDLVTGECLNAVTSGEFVVRELLRVDEAAGTVVFTASGREPGWELYDRGVYRARLDGSEVTLLTPSAADHELLSESHVTRMILAMYHPGVSLEDVNAFSPSGHHFVAARVRSGEAPLQSVFDVATGKVIDLAEVELAQDLDVRWPERFSTTSADGTTSIYGQLFLPAVIADGERVPIIDHVYLGPQASLAAMTSLVSPFGSGHWLTSAALASLGFAVTLIDGRGLPLRGKAFHDHSHGRIELTSDLSDHIAAIAQLRARHDVLADGPVGAFGHSGGGFGAARAILAYPDTYGVAVASAGNHDQRLFSFGWGERFQQLPVDDRWAAASNDSLAAELRGHLLLIHGEIDHGVHPAHTMALVDALVKADRDFDMLLVPGADHGVSTIPHVIRRSWDYLVQHLAGKTPPTGVKIRGLMELLAARAAQDAT